MNTTDTQYLIRLYQPETDLPGLVTLISAVHGQKFEPQQIQEMTQWPGHDPAKDRWVVEDCTSKELVGQGWIFLSPAIRSFIEINIHPADRLKGLGRLLMEQLAGAAKERGAKLLTAAVPAGDAVALAFLRATGFTQAGQVRFYDGPEDLSLPATVLPAGFSLRSGDSFPLQTYADACNRCYADMWGHYENLQSVTVEQLEEWHSRQPDFRPDSLFVLFAPDGSPAGVTRASMEGQREHFRLAIDAPGVAPEFRSLGLQRALVEAGVGWFKKQDIPGIYEIQTWGDFDEAVAIYESMGFELDEASYSIEFVRYL